MPPPVKLKSAAPEGCVLRPKRTVTPKIVTLIGMAQTGLSAMTLSIPFEVFVPASMMVEPDPAPLIVSESVTSRSPVASMSSLTPQAFGSVSRYVPAGGMIVSAPVSAFVSMIAARSVQLLAASAQTPLPGFTSTVSAVLLTANDAAKAGCTDRTSATSARANSPKASDLGEYRRREDRVRERRCTRLLPPVNGTALPSPVIPGVTLIGSRWPVNLGDVPHCRMVVGGVSRRLPLYDAGRDPLPAHHVPDHGSGGESALLRGPGAGVPP